MNIIIHYIMIPASIAVDGAFQFLKQKYYLDTVTSCIFAIVQIQQYLFGTPQNNICLL